MIALNLVGVQPPPLSARRHLVWLGPLLLALALAAVHTVQSRDLARLAGEVEGLRSSAAELAQHVQEANRRARASSDLAARLGLIEKLARNRGRANKLLSAVASVVSERMWLRELGLTGDAVSVTGSADTPEEVAAFLGRMDDLHAFAAVDLVELKPEAARGSAGDPHYWFAASGRFSASTGSDDKPHSPKAVPDTPEA